MEAVVVGSGLFLCGWECSGQVAKELEGCVPKSTMAFEDNWCYGLWVVFRVFVQFCEVGSVAWSGCETSGTRQSLCSGGRGYHYV